MGHDSLVVQASSLQGEALAHGEGGSEACTTVGNRGEPNMGLKPWRQVVTPHPDVATGRYHQAEFAADLAQVLAGKAEPEYQDPVEFFVRTYLTEGISRLLQVSLERLSGQGGEPVIQLKTAFGGGKTHTMLALYHLVCAGTSPEQLAGIPANPPGRRHRGAPPGEVRRHRRHGTEPI